MNKLLLFIIFICCFVFSLFFFNCTCNSEAEVILSTNHIYSNQILVSNLSEFAQLTEYRFYEDPFNTGSFNPDYIYPISLFFGDRKVLLSDSFNSALAFSGNNILIKEDQDSSDSFQVNGLPHGLQLKIIIRTNVVDGTLDYIEFQLEGNATVHDVDEQGTSELYVTLPSNFFKKYENTVHSSTGSTTYDTYYPSDINLRFFIVFGTPQEETWGLRRGHQIVNYRDNLLLLGGHNGNFLNDSWALIPLQGWNLIVSNNAWSGRYNHQAFLHSSILIDSVTGESEEIDYIYLMGGVTDFLETVLNDVWRSSDGGLNWEEIASETNLSLWQPRQGHQAISYADSLWMIGGMTDIDTIHRDIWFSGDLGTNWTMSTDQAPWTNRHGHQIFTHNNDLWLMGGINQHGERLNDIWKSSDGEVWELVTNNVRWSPRYGHQCLSYDGKIWVIGGNIDPDGFISSASTNDVWSSENGIDWKLVVSSAGISNRFNYDAIVHADTMRIFAGEHMDSEYLSDAWSSVNGITWLNISPIKIFQPFRDDGGVIKY